MTAAATRRAARPNGWFGMLILVATEASLFGTLMASYVYLRFQTRTWPPHGVPEPAVTAPVVLALVLVASSLPMAFAARAADRGARRAALAGIAIALVVQAVYLGLQFHLYADDLDRFRPSANAYSSIYFTLLAVHHIHVAVGVLLDLWLLARLSRRLTTYRRTAVSAVAFYWYFVAVVGLFVTATITSPRW
jgi:heme/copper-type cytochrome/quinol oxidase subunit 3